ncbi:hypothetical protein ACQR16_23415 [Bradyrhizobium oligotrophicum]|uniref:hypothetical protein n=1 Tax=Bradyrhizobium oligotrophicum TaxID=44255 RepID=UPI003EBE2C49
MTITVTPNPNGTITISCGTESMIIGAASGTPKAPDTPIPILWPNPGPAASIIAERKQKTTIVHVPSNRDLLRMIMEQHELNRLNQKPTIFEFHVQGEEPLSVEEVSKAFADLGNPDWMIAQIKMTGGRV